MTNKSYRPLSEADILGAAIVFERKNKELTGQEPSYCEDAFVMALNWLIRSRASFEEFVKSVAEEE